MTSLSENRPCHNYDLASQGKIVKSFDLSLAYLLRISHKSCNIASHLLYIMIFGDLSAYVFIDDQELPEYAVVASSTPTENRITCWIASEEGKVCHSSYILAEALHTSTRNLESGG